MSELIGANLQFNNIHRGQVFLTTHDGEGNSLSDVARSYISFTYGGRKIEDFGVLVTMGDRLNRGLYAEFEDINSDYETIDGQYYWGTRAKENRLNFTLSTDGMTQNELDDFKQFFKPGIERPLILSEHPNRVILARVNTAPSMSVIPFQTFHSITIDGEKFEIPTALYKGDIELSFVMDDPYWYGQVAYIDELGDATSISNNRDGTLVKVPLTIDKLKMALEDHLPLQRNLNTSVFLGGLTMEPIVTDTTLEGSILRENYPQLNVRLGLIVNLMSSENGYVNIDNETPAYLYYSGNAPAKPRVNFTINLIFDENGLIKFPNNGLLDSELYPYSCIQIGDQEPFYFSLPAIYYNYNKVIKKLDTYSDLSDLKEFVVNEIKEKFVRTQCLSTIELYFNTGNSEIDKNAFINQMKSLFVLTNDTLPTSFTFDSTNGDALGIIPLMGYENGLEQNVGDMIRSRYLIIDQTCPYELGHSITQDDCLTIQSTESLEHFSIAFRNTYR